MFPIYVNRKNIKAASMMKKYNTQHSLQDETILNAELPSEISLKEC